MHSLWESMQAVLGAKLWHKARAPGKCKFFIWLVLHYRCWTVERRKRHNLQDDDSCALCDQLPETIDHLLIGCPISREVWHKTLRRLGCHQLTPPNNSACFADWWAFARKQVARENRKCFDTLVVLASWLIWKERNRTFDHVVRSPEELLVCVKDEAVMWLKARHKQLEGVALAFGRTNDVVYSFLLSFSFWTVRQVSLPPKPLEAL
jgi:hypothetical protein